MSLKMQSIPDYTLKLSWFEKLEIGLFGFYYLSWKEIFGSKQIEFNDVQIKTIFKFKDGKKLRIELMTNGYTRELIITGLIVEKILRQTKAPIVEENLGKLFSFSIGRQLLFLLISVVLVYVTTLLEAQLISSHVFQSTHCDFRCASVLGSSSLFLLILITWQFLYPLMYVIVAKFIQHKKKDSRYDSLFFIVLIIIGSNFRLNHFPIRNYFYNFSAWYQGKIITYDDIKILEKEILIFRSKLN